MATANDQLDAPMYDPKAWRLNKKQADLTAQARKLGQEKFAGRADKWDRDAVFPMENYKDLHKSKLLGHLRSVQERRHRRRLHDLHADRRRDRALLRHHVADLEHARQLLPVDRRPRRRPQDDGVPAQDPQPPRGPSTTSGSSRTAPSTPSRFPRAARRRRGTAPFGTTATKADGGWLINGKKIFASLAGSADYYGVLCTEKKQNLSRRDTMYVAVPADAEGVSVVGDWDPLGMRGTVSRNLLFDNVCRQQRRTADAQGNLFRGGDQLAAHVPDPDAHLHGHRPGGLRFHRQVSARRSAGHAAGEAADVSDQATGGGQHAP